MAGPFIRIIGFSIGAAIAHILVSLIERRASLKLIWNLEINLNVYSFHVSNSNKHIE